MFRPNVEVRKVLIPAPQPVKPFFKDFFRRTHAALAQPPPPQAPQASPRSGPAPPGAPHAHSSTTAPPSHTGAAHAQEPMRGVSFQANGNTISTTWGGDTAG